MSRHGVAPVRHCAAAVEMAIPFNMGKPDMPADRYATVTDALRLFYQRSQRVFDRIMSSEGASFAQTKLLMFIASGTNVRSADIARVFGFAPRTVTESLDILERDGLIRRKADPLDRRAKILVLTPAGQATLAASEPTRKRITAQLFGALDDGEIDQFASLLGKMIARLDTIDAGRTGRDG